MSYPNNDLRLLLACFFLTIFSFPLSFLAQCPQLVWSDEFSGSSLDLSKWDPQIGDGCDINLCSWGNNELEYYKAENATVSNGTLKITAKEERVRSKKYTSARIRTKNLGDWTYGRFEASIKLPFGQGIWPAFWMLPTDEVYGFWPQSGEIDIMELVGHEPATAHGTIHYGLPSPNNQFQGGSYKLHSGIFNDAFHEFAIEWEPGEIRWYIDGYHYLTKTTANVAPYTWPFDQDFHFLLNVAVGGNWPGSPDNSTVFPQVMEVDYVRVYDGNLASMSGPRTVANQATGTVYSIANPGSGASISWTVPSGASIVSGQNTSSIVVDWGTSGGIVEAQITSSCQSKTISLDVLVEAPFILEQVLENFDDPSLMTFDLATGTLTEDVANPAPNAVNGSALSGQYDRNASEQYDVLQYTLSAISDADAFVNNQKKFFMDVRSNAPIGTLILLQLENSSSATGSNYPTGRHSRYEAITTVQNQWERLEFVNIDQPDGAVPGNSVDRLVLLFASNSSDGSTYYFDNFETWQEDTGNPTNQPPSVSISSPANNASFNSLNPITIEASASDSDGSIQEVEFFVDGASIGVDASSPYSIAWTPPADGTYSLTATALDDDNASTTSGTVDITVNSGSVSYCSSSSSNSNNEWISNMSVGSFSNSSGKSTYSDFTSLNANLATGSQSVTLTPSYQGPSRNEGWRIWIDFNEDGDFDDAGEQVFQSSVQAGTINGSMTIPASADGVHTRMRISMKRNSHAGPCESFSRGEVEDYSVSIGTARRARIETIKGDWIVYPNPGLNYLRIKNTELQEEAIGEIVDVHGRSMISFSVHAHTNVSAKGLAAGIYLVKIYNSEGVLVHLQKWMKSSE